MEKPGETSYRRSHDNKISSPSAPVYAEGWTLPGTISTGAFGLPTMVAEY
jgi:hypothetical protein